MSFSNRFKLNRCEYNDCFKSRSLSSSIKLNPGNVAYLLILLSACLPKLAKFFYMSYRLIIGCLYPTYLSYKALKNKDGQELVNLSFGHYCSIMIIFISPFLDKIVDILGCFHCFFHSRRIFRYFNWFLVDIKIFVNKN